jgi:hypothetical protein
MPAEVVSIDHLRAARDAEKTRKTRQIGNCARGARDECGSEKPGRMCRSRSVRQAGRSIVEGRGARVSVQQRARSHSEVDRQQHRAPAGSS